jgi:TatD DNase family protein
MKFFDTHCHLGGEELKSSALELAERAKSSGVMGLALIAADQQSLHEVDRLKVQIAQKNPDMIVLSTSGIHPHDAKNLDDDLWNHVRHYASGPASAIGETGLDYHYNFSDKKTQIDVFEKHIDLACELRKPLVIHCREAKDDVYRMLNRSSMMNHPMPGILHCFTEDLAFAKKILDLNMYISFSGIVSFKGATALREVAEYVPMDRLLIETDAPYLAPVPYRGKVNEPAFVKNVFDTVVSLKKLDPLEFANKLWHNSCTIYQVPVSS